MILWYSVALTAAYIFRLWSFFCGNASQRAGGGGGDLLYFCTHLESCLQQNTIEGFHM